MVLLMTTESPLLHPHHAVSIVGRLSSFLHLLLLRLVCINVVDAAIVVASLGNLVLLLVVLLLLLLLRTPKQFGLLKEAKDR